MSDIFVALPPATADGSVIFGKNSDRPSTEVQEVVYSAAATHPAGSSLQCTFLAIDQVSSTHAVILSKPAWSWGAEMGANEHGVCIGNTAVWTKLCNQGNQEKKLIGADFVRLGLERSESAKQAVDVMTGLLEKYGQSGPASQDPDFSQWTHDNGYIIADRHEAWILETAGQHWAAQQITKGVMNISGCLTISTQIDAMSPGLKEAAQTLGYWNPADGDFDFAKAFSSEYTGMAETEAQRADSRLQKGRTLLETASQNGKFSLENMLAILRDEESSINYKGSIVTVASQVSVLPPRSSKSPCTHWMTGTPDPSFSFFKPFVFSTNPVIGKATVSAGGDDQRHLLYRMHEKGRQLMSEGSPAGQTLLTTLQNLEKECINDLFEFFKNLDESKLVELSDIFKDVVDSEVKFYK